LIPNYIRINVRRDVTTVTSYFCFQRGDDFSAADGIVSPDPLYETPSIPQVIQNLRHGKFGIVYGAKTNHSIATKLVALNMMPKARICLCCCFWICFVFPVEIGSAIVIFLESVLLSCCCCCWDECAFAVDWKRYPRFTSLHCARTYMPIFSFVFPSAHFPSFVPPLDRASSREVLQLPWLASGGGGEWETCLVQRICST